MLSTSNTGASGRSEHATELDAIGYICSQQ